MKRILLIVAMLLMAAPVLAAVTITASQAVQDGPVTISYTADVNVRAFALDINVGGAMTIDDICDFNVGDTNGYGIFPGKFRDVPINPVDPNWKASGYNPVASLADPDANDTGLGGKYITVELGSLGVVDLATIRSGTLFRLVCDCNGGPSSLLHLTANATRGGVVDGNGGTFVKDVNLTLNDCTVVCTCTAIVPDVVDKTEAQAIIDIQAVDTLVAQHDAILDACSCTITAGKVVATNPAKNATVACGSTVKYGLSLGTWPVPNVYDKTMNDANALILAAHYKVGTRAYSWHATVVSGNVCAQSPAAGGRYVCDSNVNYTVSRGLQPTNCMPAAGTGYDLQRTQFNTYVTNLWDPTLWCAYNVTTNPKGGYQCHGDADGAKSSPDNYRIFTFDLNLISANWKKKMLAYPNGADPRADIDHKASSPDNYRVFTGDLSRITTAVNWKRKDTPCTACVWPTVCGLPKNCPLKDAGPDPNNANYVRPRNCP